MPTTEPDWTKYEAQAQVLKALAHPTRLYIVERLQEQEHCVCELTELVGADTSTVSKHLALLKQSGVVLSRKVRTTVYYRLACDCIGTFLEGVGTVLRQNAERSARGAEMAANGG